MKPIVSEKDFPTANKFVYLNAANVALMYSGAEQIITEWIADVAQNGSNNFDDHAEENVFKDLHQAVAHLINASTGHAWMSIGMPPADWVASTTNSAS